MSDRRPRTARDPLVSLGTALGQSVSFHLPECAAAFLRPNRDSFAAQ